jgi:putative hydrolase of HD superfamily
MGQMEFLAEIDKMKTIMRQTLILDGSRPENDAEHSWHMAMFALTLQEHSAFPINIDRVVKMALVHDLVEVYAGDTFAYDTKGYEGKEEREREAAVRLFSMLPERQADEFRSLWEEFEMMKTGDAIFAAACDRLQPFVANCRTGWHTWVKNGVASEQVLQRMAPVKEAIPGIWGFVESQLEKAKKAGAVF